ncbi:MAG: hypothetical protein KDA87_16630, partial [Planctomycetales bacterium]|nr:hypothetical protein [Planctomycetales bacterium]
PSGATSEATVSIEISGESDARGDLDGDSLINANDIDLLCRAVNSGFDPRFDLNGSNSVSLADLDALVRNILGTTYGDSNLDGVFNSTDLIRVFQAGQYEDQIEDNSTWATGDWDCDREFDTSDLIRAFQLGTYSQNARDNAFADIGSAIHEDRSKRSSKRDVYVS